MNYSGGRTVFLSEHIEKKRKTEHTEITEQESLNLSVSAEMKKNIETTFQDQIKQLMKDAPSLAQSSNTIESSSILSEVNVPICKIPCYSRQFEESMMRPPESGEKPCINADNCECTQIALQEPTVCDTSAFIGVGLDEPHAMCILCIRRKVSQAFYHYLITKTSPETCIQPHYNIVNQPMEYNKNCVFLPTSLAGITDPFVMHLRHNYKYENGIISQTMVNFSNASFMYNSKTLFLQKNLQKENCTQVLKCNEAEYFARINQSKNFQERFKHEYSLYGALPQIYDKQFKPTSNTNIQWKKTFSSILDASFFLPIIFGTKLQTDKITKNIPIIHIISKGLPQRSQFRNFLNISLTCLERSKDFQLFFKQLFVWSIIGIHYKWNKVCIPIEKRIFLFEMCCIQDTDWKKILTVNVRLFFFMIKEYLCYIVQQNVGLYDTLLELTEWIKYETEIFNVMNEVRHIYSTSTVNPLKQMLSLTQKLLPRPNIVSWPKGTKLPCIFSNSYKLNEILMEMGYKPKLKKGMETITEYKHHLQTLKFHLLSSSQFQNMVECNRTSDTNLKELLQEIPVTETILQDFINVMFIERILNSISQTMLPIHQVERQLKVSIKKHDLNINDASFKKTLYETTTYYFCIGCQDVKSCYDYGQKKKENTIFAYGHTKLALDPYTRKTYCMGTNSRRKQKETPCQAVPCLKIPVFGKIVTFFGKSFIICSICGTLCTVKMNDSFLKNDMIACGNCDKVDNAQEFCGYCVRKSTALMSYRCYNDEEEDKYKNPWGSIWLCPRHRNSHWHQNKVLLKSVLFKNLNDKV
tara:strand:- start:190 stop:2616 length:2427 start_codon:yes stop_codon:yes gene_type:complete